MRIFNYIKNIDLPILVLNLQGEVVAASFGFNNIFGADSAVKKFQKFKNSFSIQSCALNSENIINYNPINLALRVDGNFKSVATYQKSEDEYMTFLISSSKINKYYIIEFTNLTNEYKLNELETNYKQAKSELDTIKKENAQNLETKDKAQNQAIKMALLNRIFETLRQTIDLDVTLNLAFKELSEIFGFSKVAFAFYDDENEQFEIKNIFPQRYKDELSKILDIDKNALSQLKDNKFTVSNIANSQMGKNVAVKTECRILMPIYHSNKLIGSIYAIFPRQNLNNLNEDMINAISAQLTSAIVQSYLFQELNNKNEQLQKAYTQLEQAQLQLINSEKMASLGQLVAGVAHEINTPLASINSNNSLFEKMLSVGEFDSDIIDMLKSMTETDKEAIKRISNIVKSLKRFVRLDEAELQEANINKELDLTLELLKHETKKRIEIIKDYGEIGEIKCYPNLLNQVFMNILMNAVQSIEGEGKIFITTKIENNNLIISIRDTGSGMDEQTKAKIFKSGFTTKKVGIGTGLGLMITKDIIKKHSGEITFNSKLGEGTEFIISIPILSV